VRLPLTLHALRAATPRQLYGRTRRPLARRRFPGGSPPRAAAGVRGAADLWRSEAFAPLPAPDPATRLGQFHRHYGDDVLAAARAGELETAQGLIAGWIAANPPRDGDAWHPYPLSTRVGNWVAALTLLPGLGSSQLDESLWRQLLHLEANVEDDVLGNHVVRNARALVLGGLAFRAERLVGRGLAILRRELPVQVLPDGGHYERSPTYHLVVLRDLLEVRAATGEPSLAGPIEAMRGFAVALQRPDGAPALFNDGSLELAPALDLPAAPEGLALFPDTGYAVVRSGGLWLAFDCGPVAPPFLPAHAHADALSIQLWWQGRPVLVDTGTSTYDPGAERDRLRSTAAHSTVTVDGGSQFEPWRAFRAGPLPEVRLLDAAEDALVASVAWPGGVSHLRRVEWIDGAVVVRDRMLGRGRHRLESRLVLAPGPPEARIEALAESGALVTEPGFVAERFGEHVPTGVLVSVADCELPAELGWRIGLPG
jgi:Heparinase II/III-like protein/Heparinase II/III N-terminus